MVRGKPIEADIKKLIITEYQKMGKPYQQISTNLGIARSTVHNIIKKFEEHMAIDVKPKYGCPRKTNIDDDLSLQKVVKLNPTASLVQIKRKWEIEMLKDVSMTTCRRRLHELGIQIPQRPPFQSIREPEVNIYAEEDKIPQRPGSSLLEEQSLDTESRQENNENKYQEHHHQTKRRKSKKSSNSKKRAKNSATVQATLDSLQTVTKAISAQHDEFSLFGEYMAMSLRTMPMRNALRCKEKLLSVIVNERLNVGSENI